MTKSDILVIAMAWQPSPWAHPMQQPNLVPVPLMDPWTLLKQRDAEIHSHRVEIRNLQFSIDAKDKQIAAMTKSQQVGKNAHKKEMERVRKDSDAKANKLQL